VLAELGLPVVVVALVAWRPALVSPRRWRMWLRRGRPRKAVPARVRRAVLWADGARCILPACRLPSRTLDHIKPYSLGFRASRWNMAVLCPHHNTVKSNYWRARDGRVFYRGWGASGNREEAAAIYAAEVRAARRMVRLARLYLRRS
jgi:5-methylcytosine-specific restriction endonuclease McrA